MRSYYMSSSRSIIQVEAHDGTGILPLTLFGSEAKKVTTKKLQISQQCTYRSNIFYFILQKLFTYPATYTNNKTTIDIGDEDLIKSTTNSTSESQVLCKKHMVSN